MAIDSIEEKEKRVMKLLEEGRTFKEYCTARTRIFYIHIKGKQEKIRLRPNS
ncbi:MAG TPA: hypothetical protein VFY50_02460 [Candidatus Nitrosocosmicus sp.]|nr:hypothetical protein [Candidatus Nitrosocosmicus sp.]